MRPIGGTRNDAASEHVDTRSGHVTVEVQGRERRGWVSVGVGEWVGEWVVSRGVGDTGIMKGG